MQEKVTFLIRQDVERDWLHDPDKFAAEVRLYMPPAGQQFY